jgi:hypothetical protein
MKKLIIVQEGEEPKELHEYMFKTAGKIGEEMEEVEVYSDRPLQKVYTDITHPTPPSEVTNEKEK